MIDKAQNLGGRDERRRERGLGQAWQRPRKRSESEHLTSKLSIHLHYYQIHWHTDLTAVKNLNLFQFFPDETWTHEASRDKARAAKACQLYK